MPVKYDSLLRKIRIKDVIVQVDTDPTGPHAQDAWVLRTAGSTSGGGSPIGMLLALTTPGVINPDSYQFSYRTKEGTTIRTTLS